MHARWAVEREKASEKLTVWQNFLLEYKNLFFNKPITCHVLPYIKIYIVIRQRTLHFPVKCSPLFHFLHGNRSIYLKTIIIIIRTLEVFFSSCIHIHIYKLSKFLPESSSTSGNRKHVHFLVGFYPHHIVYKTKNIICNHYIYINASIS